MPFGSLEVALLSCWGGLWENSPAIEVEKKEMRNIEVVKSGFQWVLINCTGVRYYFVIWVNMDRPAM